MRPLPNFTKGHRDGRGPRRRQDLNASTLCCARSTDTRVRSAGQWPRFGQRVALAGSLRPLRPTRRPLVARRSLSCHRLAQGSGRARGGKEAVDGAHWKGDANGQEREPFRRRRQLAEADPRRSEANPSSPAVGAGRARAQRRKTAGRVETRSRP